MLKLNLLQKLFFTNLLEYSSKFNIYYFLTPAATSKALIRRKTNREKSEINYMFTFIRNIYRSEKWMAQEGCQLIYLLLNNSGIFQLHHIAKFLPKPVVTAFTTGLCFHIATSQGSASGIKMHIVHRSLFFQHLMLHKLYTPSSLFARFSGLQIFKMHKILIK